jgi:hypothetical protein
LGDFEAFGDPALGGVVLATGESASGVVVRGEFLEPGFKST